MKKSIFTFVLSIFLFSLSSLECSKKVAKVEPVTEQKAVSKPVLTEKKPAAIVTIQEPVAAKKEIPIFQDVNFDFDKYDLRQDCRAILANHAKNLISNPKIKLQIEGHCDERGTIEYNLALGEKRANTVKVYLTNYGVESSRLTTISYGKEKPLDIRHNEEAWAKNRRATFIIIEQ